jgi:hypothetical protein
MADRKSNRKRTGQNNSVFQMKTTPGAGRRTRPTNKPAAKPAPKPAAKPQGETWRSKVSHTDYATLRKGQDDAIRNHPANKKPAPAPKPQPKPSSSPAPVQSRTSPSTPPADKVPAAASKSSSGGSYGADGKGLYNAHKKDNPLMKRTFGYQTGDHGSKEPKGTGPVADGKAYAASKEADDKRGRTSGQGTVASGAEYGNALKKSQEESKKRAEQMKIKNDEIRKKRSGTAWGGA